MAHLNGAGLEEGARSVLGAQYQRMFKFAEADGPCLEVEVDLTCAQPTPGT